MRGRRVVGSSQSFLCPPSITCFTGHYVYILSVPRIRICSSFEGLAAFTKECPPQTTRRLFGSWSKDRPPAPDFALAQATSRPPRPGQATSRSTPACCTPSWGSSTRPFPLAFCRQGGIPPTDTVRFGGEESQRVLARLECAQRLLQGPLGVIRTQRCRCLRATA